MAKRELTISSLSEDIEQLMTEIGTGDLPLSQRAYFIIKDLIINLKLIPGQMILEKEVVAALGMSRTPVREALVRLEMEGWIQIVPRRGFVVVEIKVEDIQQIFEVVESLDELATSLATRHGTDEAFATLEQMIQMQEEALDADDLLAWLNLDMLFHKKIMDMSNNLRLKRLRESEYDHLYRLSLYTIEGRTPPRTSVIEHRAIITSMMAREGEAARLLLKTHRMRTLEDIKQALERIKNTH